ncbi:hypothetical protein MPTK1_3g09400 [Marchantia polymorpha subsp. ruderalis]|uniref:AB hydrolase-1 domain-containing protein n=2 Tax=Marchantia polymorpha TaxID=3197 RepID=A0A176WQM4_MARPO|nr:hypothetical protein AXG93_2528s1920 [Marchantia polymorpha subsp. ruderalis]PTQ33882.1 hypothetical protein MARPO_0085s0087 [Marchantia polymorpha]BBN04993.1 hypothetical protein Mp_3g09400 [Marchantia polymorpha subsp. ruderalis]|eukprot:PTQ33882.1 hypothetical protein MARPO_0085s0087 [Marchantia polymorpha]
MGPKSSLLWTLVFFTSATYHAAFPISLPSEGMTTEAESNSRHVVLVHGSGLGAWCWYKMVNLLQKRGYTVAAIDLTSQGRDRTNPDTVTTLDEYAKPLLNYLENLNGQAFLVAHSLGGITVSFAMEKYPQKIQKAVFVTSRMPLNNQSSHTSLPPESTEPGRPSDFVILNYANGPSAPPTSFSYNLSYIQDMFFNETPDQDVTLAMLSMSPTPYAISFEVLKLTPARYGSVRRFYVFTLNDHLSTPAAQQFTIDRNPPERVFKIRSDHSPFVSHPRQLTNIFEMIYNL